MRTSCIRHPEKSRYIQLHQWQIEFCDGSHCAAILLSFFAVWHDWKLKNDGYYRRVNNVAEMHGKGRPCNQNAYLFFTMDDLIEGCFGLYKKDSINKAIDFLQSLCVISIHRNPNPNYRYDLTRHFKFYPAVCNNWISKNYSLELEESENSYQLSDYTDTRKIADASDENPQTPTENRRGLSENRRPITNTTCNTTIKNKQTNARAKVDSFKNTAHETQAKIQACTPIVDLLIAKGMPANRLQTKEDLTLLSQLVSEGATEAIVSKAYEISVKATTVKGNSFNVRYLTKVITDLLQREKSQSRSLTSGHIAKTTEKLYENDFSGGLSWMGDLVSENE